MSGQATPNAQRHAPKVMTHQSPGNITDKIWDCRAPRNGDGPCILAHSALKRGSRPLTDFTFKEIPATEQGRYNGHLAKQGREELLTAAVDRGPSEGARSGSKESFSLPCAHLLIMRPGRARRMVWMEAVCVARRTRASCARDPGGIHDDWMRRYCTSTVMVWEAATSAWSFVAPVTVIWCVPLARPLNDPVKPF